MKRILYLALLLGVVGVLAWLQFGQASKAPDSTFVLLDGSQLRSSDLRGKVVLINFWATSCASCVAEMPSLVSTHAKFAARGYDTVAVAMSYDPPTYVQNFARSRQLPFKVALDSTGGIAQAWGDVRLTPTSLLVDKHGMIVKRYVGPPEFSELHRLIDELLEQQG